MKFVRKLAVQILVVLSLSLMAQAKWQAGSKTPEQSKILEEVEQRVEQTKNPVVIFDLDSTLYDNRYRSAAIWREYGLKKVEARHITSWVIEDYLVKDAGLEQKWVEKNIKDLKSFWAKRFFSSEYLRYDKVLPGAVKYVNRLYKKGAMIVYASGRDAVNMKEGTLKFLKRDGFPLDEKRTKVLLKPESNIAFSEKYKSEAAYKKALKKADVAFKENAVREILKMGTPVASFDNEPANINLYFRRLHDKGKHGFAVWLDTDHSPHPEPLQKGIVTVIGFKR